MKCFWCWDQKPRGTWWEVRIRGETLWLCLDCQRRAAIDRTLGITIEGSMAYWAEHYSPTVKARRARRRRKERSA